MNTVVMKRLITLTNQVLSIQEEINELKFLAQQEDEPKPKRLSIMRIEKCPTNNLEISKSHRRGE